jgi:hypothetical protein
MEKLGTIQGLSVFYDQYQEDDILMIGWRDNELDFVIGNTRDMEFYEKAISNYYKNYG